MNKIIKRIIIKMADILNPANNEVSLHGRKSR